jgi:taurine-pyruvate aminotransferase
MEEDLFGRSATLGERLLAKLSGLKELPYVGDVRGKGRQIGMELVKDQESKQPASAEKVAISDCQERGLIIGKSGDSPSYQHLR